MPHDPAQRRAYMQQWRATHRDHIRLYDRKRYQDNPEPKKQRSSRWKDANRDRARARDRTRRTQNLEESRAKARKRIADKKQHVNALQRQWYAANKHRVREKKNRKYAENPSYYIALQKEWMRLHPEYNSIQYGKRRAREALALRNDFTMKQWRTMIDLVASCCVYCDRHMQRLTVDHLTPFVAGGSHTLWNILPACRSCNSKKKAGPVLKPVQPFLLLP